MKILTDNYVSAVSNIVKLGKANGRGGKQKKLI